MPPEVRPLQVLVISSDVPLLHEAAWMLEAVGYHVQTTTDFDQLAHWRRYATADFILLDGRGITEPTVETFSCNSPNQHYRIFLYDPAKQADIAAWYAAGAHDALRAPVSRGELLARIRTGARYLEFERRLRQKSLRCESLGINSRLGLIHSMRKLMASKEHNSASSTLVVTSIDWFEGIRCQSGEATIRNLETAVARSIQRVAEDRAIPAYFENGKFVTLLEGRSTTDAKKVAENLADDFGTRESHRLSSTRPTLTSAVISWHHGSGVEQILNEALETHSLAEQSGGDCVVAQGDFAKELAAWREEMTTGSPFANVVAQDIMEPFPALLEQEFTPSKMEDALRRANVPIRPYVDRSGRLVGVEATDQSVRETRVDMTMGKTGESIAMPETIPFDASFPEIYEAFSSRGCSTLIVTAENQPVGYLTCDSFLSLIDPIDRSSFARAESPNHELLNLVVPSTISEVAAV